MIEACDGLPGEVAVAEVVPTRCVLDTRVPVSDYQKTVKKKNISKLIVTIVSSAIGMCQISILDTSLPMSSAGLGDGQQPRSTLVEGGY